MRVLLHILVFLSGMAIAPAIAVAAEPFVRAAVRMSGQIVPGRQITVDVDVFAPNYFLSAPQFPLLDMPNAVVRLPDQRSLNLVETVDGVKYAGIRKSYAIVPQMAGDYELPPVAIDLVYAGDDGKPVKGAARMPSTTFFVAAPSNDIGADTPFAPSSLTITQSLDRDPAKLKVGDALVRTIDIFAVDMQAMLIPAIDVPRLPFAKSYPQAPRLRDDVQNEQHRTGAQRTERVTYALTKTGIFEIPAASIAWFDVSSGSSRTATAPAVTVNVGAAPLASDGIAPGLADGQTSRRALRRLIKISAAAMLAVCALVLAYWSLLRLRLRARRRFDQWRSSEPARFRQVLRTLRSGQESAAYNAVETWVRSAGFRTIDDYAAAAGVPELQRALEDFQRTLFAPGPTDAAFDHRGLRRALVKGRKAVRSHARSARRRPSALPPLNPHMP